MTEEKDVVNRSLRLIKASDFRFILFVLLIIPAFYMFRMLLMQFGIVKGATFDLAETISTEAGIAAACALVYSGVIALRLRDHLRK